MKLLLLALAVAGPPIAALAAETPVAAPAAENPVAVAAAVRAAAAAAAPAPSTISLGPVTGAQYMPACGGRLAVGITGAEPYQQALVHCAAPDWNLYVSVTVAATAMVVTAARPIAAGQSLAPADLSLAREPVALYAGRQVFYDPSQLAGAATAMSLQAGAILTTSNIDEPLIVSAGQTVAVTVQSGVVELSIIAIADQPGRIGDTILMTNPGSGKRFSAQVTANGPLVRLQ